MQPDSYMPLYGDDFFQAVKAHGERVGWPYLKAIWHYWKHTHCKGLKNDSELLRRICEVEKSEWPELYEIIFDNEKFFTLDADGLWHQKRAALQWQTSVHKYEGRLKQTQAATKARLAKYHGHQ